MRKKEHLMHYALRITHHCMDMPIHLAAAACVGQATLCIEQRFQKQLPSKERAIILGMVCFSLSVASHLFLDMLPHYNFVYKILTFYFLPYLLRCCWTLSKNALLILPIFTMLLAFPRRSLVMLGIALLGGIYPDIEKGMYLYHLLPRSLVIFRNHSCSYSSAGWETEYKVWLIGIEIVLYLTLLWILSRPLRRRIQIETRSEKGLLSLFRQVAMIINQSLKALCNDVLHGIRRLARFRRLVDV
jgi:hypothetical protein